MAKNISNIHDKFVKQLFSEKETAISFLQTYLPDSVKDKLLFDSIEYVNTTYLSEDLATSFSDLVWRFSTTENKKVQVNLLLEHKSMVDKHTAFQVLEYIALGYRTQLKNKQNLELIIPIVYYHGNKKWDYRAITDFFDEISSELQLFVPKHQTNFINLQNLTDEQILKITDRFLAGALLLQKNYFDRKRFNNSVIRVFESLLPHLQERELRFIFVYIVENQKLNHSVFTNKVEGLPHQLNKTVMSLYEELIQKGQKQGIELGVEQGIELGAEKKGIETIINCFDNGLTLDQTRLISGETVEKIKEVLKANNRSF